MRLMAASMIAVVLALAGVPEAHARQAPPQAPSAAGASDPARALFLAGRNYWDDGRFAEAEKKFREALSKYPRSDNADRTGFYLIETLLKMGRTPEALAEMNKFFNVFPRSKWLADVQEKRTGLVGQWSGGGGGSSRALEQEVLGVLLRSDPERGLDVVRDRLKADPADAVALSNFGAIAESASTNALPLLISIARTSASAKARGNAAFWLGRARSDKDNAAVKALADIIKDDADDSVRRTAALSLGNRKEPEAMKALEDFLRNPKR